MQLLVVNVEALLATCCVLKEMKGQPPRLTGQNKMLCIER